VRVSRKTRYESFRVSHCWHTIGTDECGNLYLRESGVNERLNKFDLGLGFKKARKDLKALARTYFSDKNR
jgi:hypothetical protein